MTSARLFFQILLTIFAGLLISGLSASSSFAQGSIFGAVTNSDASIPGQGEISFYGYLDNTDEEIRLEFCIGAGYDIGNWFDDFQNYLTEAPGNPYDYHFYNLANGEGYQLSGLIPNNSFQQENVSLAPVDWPAPPVLTGKAVNNAEAVVHWPAVPGLYCHVYRRAASSDGSFYRIDDPSGSLSNPGVSDTFFVDNTVDPDGIYDYLVIAEDQSGQLGYHSDIVTIDVGAPTYIYGDPNGDGVVNVGDCVFTINYVFRDGPAPDPYLSGDANCDLKVDVGDAVFTINYVFREGPVPDCSN